MTLLQRLAIQNHPNPFITEKGWNKAKYSTWYSIRFQLVKKTSMPNPVQSLRYIKFHGLSSLRLIKRPRNSKKCNCKKICSWSRRPKTILEMRKKAWFIEVINKSIVYRFLKDFTNLWKKSKRAAVFSNRPLPNIFKYRKHIWDFQKSGKQDSFWQLLKSSTSKYKCSVSHSLRTITGTQSGPDTFDESRLVMTFLTNVRVKWILCSSD